MSVREQQRLLIESRLHKTAKNTVNTTGGDFSGGLKTPMTGKKRPPPPGLSIVPPSHEQFADDRVIRSAPLHQTFTGRHQPHPLARTVNDPHPLAAPLTHHRLPPITDVLNHGSFASHSERPMAFHSNSASNVPHTVHRPPLPSPSLPPPPARPREYRSAEEAIAEITAGREEHQPRIVHYSGHQPPTPPSPPTSHALTPHKQRHPQVHHPELHRSTSGNGRVRQRAEYERDAGSPPLGSGPSPRRAFGEGDSPMTNQAKKEEFMRLCARAWDLFHSWGYFCMSFFFGGDRPFRLILAHIWVLGKPGGHVGVGITNVTADFDNACVYDGCWEARIISRMLHKLWNKHCTASRTKGFLFFFTIIISAAANSWLGREGSGLDKKRRDHTLYMKWLSCQTLFLIYNFTTWWHVGERLYAIVLCISCPNAHILAEI